MDEARYEEVQNKNKMKWENMCTRCGACCGSVSGDMCVHLVKQEGGYSCNIYSNRFGLHKTVSGKELVCVPVRDILHKDWPGSERCAYKKYAKGK